MSATTQNTLINLLLRLGLVGIKTDSKATFKLNLVQVRYLAWNLLLYTVTGLLAYTKISGFQPETLRDTVNLVLELMTSTGALYLFIMSVSLTQLADPCFIKPCRMTVSRAVGNFLVVTVFFSRGIVLHLMKPNPHFNFNFFIDIINFCVMSTIIFIFFEYMYIVAASFKMRCEEFKEFLVVRSDDLQELLEAYETMKKGLEIPLFVFFSFQQIAWILTIYFVIDGDLSFTGVAASLLIFSIAVVHLLDNIYEHIADIAVKGEQEALKMNSLRDLIQMKAVAARLEGSGPVRGWGYFDIDKTTLLAMFATTLSYTIVMLTWP